jgi:hypothetical protein
MPTKEDYANEYDLFKCFTAGEHDLVRCPYCYEECSPSYEGDNEYETYCDSDECGKTFIVQVETSIQFQTVRVEDVTKD